ncbi:MAG: cold-shock protein, partial [Saprospiraceae bacterium]|nr:cold-shock protein [Saprospiraceae bacterium]
ENAGLRTLDENQRVSYEIESNKGKSSAIDLKLL